MPSYKLLPIIAASTPNSASFLISLISLTPPEAITGVSTAWTSAFVLSRFGPAIIPSLVMSVYIIAARGSFAASAAKSSRFWALSFVQP